MANEARDRVTVISVLADDQDRKALRGIFAHSNWELRFAPTLDTASRLLAKTSAGLLIVGEELPETSSWREALNLTQQMSNRPLLIVASRLADERLWAEVLNIGAYDVLATPFDPPEVYRVVSFAWQTWRRSKTAAGFERTELATAAASG
jgi:DNA-binding response OmpR family regulator